MEKVQITPVRSKSKRATTWTWLIFVLTSRIGDSGVKFGWRVVQEGMVGIAVLEKTSLSNLLWDLNSVNNK